MGKIIFSGHAKARSRERGIDPETVTECIKRHTVIEIKPGKKCENDLILTLPDDVEVRVVIEGQDMVVITVMHHDDEKFLGQHINHQHQEKK